MADSTVKYIISRLIL